MGSGEGVYFLWLRRYFALALALNQTFIKPFFKRLNPLSPATLMITKTNDLN